MIQIDIQKSSADQDDQYLRSIILKIKEWRKYSLSKWKLIIIGSLIGASLGLTYSILKKPVYNAELSFAVQDDSSNGKLGAAAGIASQFGIDLGGNNTGWAFSGDNLLELMRSRTMIENTLLTTVTIDGKQQTLADLYISFNNLRPIWENSPKLKNVDFLPGSDRSKFTLQQDSILGAFYSTLIKKNLSVDKADKDLSIISVKMQSKNELFSKLFIETLVKTVSDFYIETKTKKSAQNVSILQKLTDSVRRELNAAITGEASSSDINPNANPALQILKVPSRHRQVDIEANSAMLTELVKNLELSKISLRKETPLIQVIDKPILPLERKEVGAKTGIFIGAIIAGLLTIIYIIVKKRYEDIMLIDSK
jgi:hypothetical protein